MYFNFEDYRPDTPTLPRSLTRLEVVLLTVVVYLSLIIFVLIFPQLSWVKARALAQQQAIAEQQRLEQQRQRDNARFVFIAPRVDTPAKKPPQRAELSDINRKAATVERAPKPTNDMPFSRGNTIERMEGAPPARTAQPDRTEASAEETAKGLELPDSPTASQPKASDTPQPGQRGPSAGVIADAIRNVQKYVQKDTFGNLQGGGGDMDFEKSIQFDTKGVEFGPWLRRFIAQIRRNWFIPIAAMSMKGHVVIRSTSTRTGGSPSCRSCGRRRRRVQQLGVQRARGVESHAAAAAGVSGRQGVLHVTFFYNETPGS